MNMLYRKYRPQKFDDVVGQEHVVRTLKGALKDFRIGHAYLFAGPRGTGKTTIARILAKAVNCANYDFKNKKILKKEIPCGECLFCKSIENGTSLDLIEIDAASNRGIDEIRSLKESALVAAPGGNFKIFVIDEVHALTKDAFNALLKILEEPPAHVVFALATTEPHKILPTVLSRVQRFDLKRLTNKEITDKLSSIAREEGLKIENGGLKIIAQAADGALRDAEVLLSKVISINSDKEEVSANAVQEMLSLIPAHYYPEFLNHLVSKNGAEAIATIHRLHESGFDLEHFTKGLLEYMRKVLITRINPILAASLHDNTHELADHAQQIDSPLLIQLITAFTLARSEIKHSPISTLPLELAVLKLTQ